MEVSKMKLILCIVVLNLKLVAMDEVISLSYLEDMLHTHKKAIERIEMYVNQEREMLNLLTRYLAEHKVEDDDAENSKYVKNPFNAFRLFRGLTTDLNFLELKTKQHTEYEEIHGSDGLRYPTFNELASAADAMMLLQKTYRLDVNRVALEELAGTYRLPYSGGDCYEIASFAYHAKEYSIGVKWMKLALAKLLDENEEETYSVTQLIEYIAVGYRLLKDFGNALHWMHKLIALKLDDPPAFDYREFIDECKKELNNENQETQRSPEQEEKRVTLSSISTRYCLKNVLNQTLDASKTYKLTCRLLTEMHPFFRLAPLKVEVLHLNPSIMLLYDVISDADIQQLHYISVYKFRSVSTEKKASKDYKYSNIASFRKYEASAVAKLNQRIEEFSGVKSDQTLQVISFGLGGHFMPNSTSNTSAWERPSGRMMTAMFYMSTIEGGATVFPHLGVTVSPVKGACLLWESMISPMGVDLGTHAICPVLQGFSWTAIKSFPVPDETNSDSSRIKAFGNTKPFKADGRIRKLNCT